MADAHHAESPATSEPEYKIDRPKPKLTRRAKIGIGTLLAGASLAAIWSIWPANQAIPEVETSAVEEFQDQSVGSPFGSIQPATKLESGEGFANIEGAFAAQREDLEARNAALQAEIGRLQKELAELASRADSEKDATSKELALALEKAQAQNLALIDEMRRQFDREIESLRVAADNTSEADAQRAADLAAKRAAREEQLAARIASPGVVFDGGDKSGAGGTAMEMPPSAGSMSGDAAGRDFVQTGREATKVEASQIVANPSNTVLQGTLIDATLENAVDSSLPGQITAIVTRPVWSFDQAQILVPAGSRLFGEYSSKVAIGQGRILVAWTRLVTPDGQSVQMAAFGGDAQGRSGITGEVNSRFGQRFGSAALISLLGSVPTVASAKFTSEVSSETAESVGEDFSGAMGSAVEAYTSLPPVITVAPGAAITVMVDRDLEFW
jgi:type IV secretion system protein VirB10